jgi:hypothetical protein
MHDAKRNNDRHDLLRQTSFEADQSSVSGLADFDARLKREQVAREEAEARKKEQEEVDARRAKEMKARQEKQKKKDAARAKALAMSTS